MPTIEIENDRRKIFYDSKTKMLFTTFIFFTILMAIFMTGTLLANLGFQFFSPGKTGEIFTFGNETILVFIILWSLYGYLIAYTYAYSKVQGIIFRMGRIFERITEKQSVRLTFRRGDPFHSVSDSFHRMLDKVRQRPDLKKELQLIIRDAEAPTREKLENLLKKF